MRCPEVQQKLYLLAGEQLASSDRERIEAHLSGCDQCRQELRRQRRLGELLASAPLPPVPKGFAKRVVSLARREESSARGSASVERFGPERFGHGVRIGVGMAAALAAGLLLGGYLGFDTWQSDGSPAAFVADDPLVDSGFGHLVEPGGDSLAQAYMALISGGDT